MTPLLAADGQTAVCPAHNAHFQVLFARHATVGAAQIAPANSTSASMAGNTVAGPGIDAQMVPGAMCAAHPTAAAVTYCEACRAPVCSTCLFIFPGGIKLCAGCAANPRPQMSSKRAQLLGWSVGLAIWSFLALIAMFVFVTLLPGRQTAELLGSVFYLVSLLPALVGIALGFATRDSRLRTPGLVWFGIIGNGLVLVVWLVLILIGLARI
jgi:hypothetical protein